MTSLGLGEGSGKVAPPGFSIRQADLADVPRLVDLGRRTFEAAFGAMNTAADMATYLAEAFCPEQMTAELQTLEAWFLIASDRQLRQGESLGYAQLVGRGDDPEVTTYGPAPVEIVRLYLEPWAWGQGYGDLLMAACCDRARLEGYQTLVLGVWEHNPRARRFYARWGFEECGEKIFWLGKDRQRDLFLRRSL